MISPAHKCGCRIHDKPQVSTTSLLNHNPSLQSCLSTSTTDSDDSYGCGCSPPAVEELEKPSIVSEIASKGLPYKEIETTFNNNRLVVRLQKEKPKPEFEPPCDCVETEPGESQNNFGQGLHNGNDFVLQKVGQGCRTVSVYPNPEQRVPEAPSANLPTVNLEENPNIFVLKIRRKCDKNKLDLEYRSPRPWSRVKKNEVKC